MQELQDLHVAVRSRSVHRHYRTSLCAVFEQPSDNVQMAIRSSGIHSIRGAAFCAVLMQPLDDVQMALASSVVHVKNAAFKALKVIAHFARIEVRKANVAGLVHPLDHLKMASPCSISDGATDCPKGIHLMQPLDNMEMASSGSPAHGVIWEAVSRSGVNPLYHVQMAVASRHTQ